MAAIMRDTVIVDADAHVNPPTEIWTDYLPESLRELALRIERGGNDEDCDYVVFEGKRKNDRPPLSGPC